MRPVLAVALAAHVVLSAVYLVSTPAFEAPDENGHYQYAFHLAHARELPVVPGTTDGSGRGPLDEVPMGFHPPAYYALLAATLHALGRPDTSHSLLRNPEFGDWDRRPPSMNLLWLHGSDETAPVSEEIATFRVLRGWSVLFGLVTLVLIHRLGLLAFPGRPGIADLAALLVACSPMWSYVHGVVNNDAPATLASHALLLVLATALVRGRFPPVTGAAAGGLLGISLITKLTTLFLVPVVVAAYAYAAWRWPAERRRTLASAAVALGLVLALSGWFFLRNVRLYGDPLALALGAQQVGLNRIPEGRVLEWLRRGFLPQVCRSFLGHFGWWILPPARWLVHLGQVLVALSAVGLVVDRIRRTAPRPRLLVLALLGGAFLGNFAMILRLNLTYGQPQGRYLFPTAAFLALVFAWGLEALVRRLPRALRRAVAPAGVAGLVALAAVVLVRHYRPAFRPELAPAPPHHASLVGGLATPPDEPSIELLGPPDGSEVAEPPVLRWRAPEGDPGPYTVHVYTAAGRILHASHAWFHRAVHDGEWTFPAEGWPLVQAGEEIRWKVRRIPDRSRGEGVDDVPASPAFRFTRVE